MKILLSLRLKNFRAVFMTFYAFSVMLPLLVLIYFIFQYVNPYLTDEQVEQFRPVFTYGMGVMVLIPLIGIFIVAARIRMLENITQNVVAKSAEVANPAVGIKNENEILTLYDIFNHLQQQLQDSITQLSDWGKKIISSNIHLSELAITDELTTLYNRRYFELTLREEIARAERYHYDLSLIILDLDEFKDYNDSFGHPAGDQLLMTLGRLIRTSIRQTDLPFRYGGDEFAILAPGCDNEGAKLIARKISRIIAGHTFGEGTTYAPVRLTISWGVASYSEGGHDDLVARADKDLYLAKTAGKELVKENKGLPAETT
jgi:diguanylate cyclase (GGDEF)-like protein